MNPSIKYTIITAVSLLILNAVYSCWKHRRAIKNFFLFASVTKDYKALAENLVEQIKEDNDGKKVKQVENTKEDNI